jgi:hypothetical protein
MNCIAAAYITRTEKIEWEPHVSKRPGYRLSGNLVLELYALVRKCRPLSIAQTLAKEQAVKCKYCAVSESLWW